MDWNNVLSSFLKGFAWGTGFMLAVVLVSGVFN